MKTFRVKMTDDSILEVQAPENATDDEIIAIARQQKASETAAPAMGPVAPENYKETIAGTIAGGANVARGAIPSVGQVVRQVAGTAEPVNMASAAGNMARRFIGPYGAVTSAADAERRFAEGNYGQAAISGLGAAGYGMSSLGNLFPPAKIPGMVVGGAADVANMGIDAITDYIRRMALQRAQEQGQGTYQAP